MKGNKIASFVAMVVAWCVVCEAQEGGPAPIKKVEEYKVQTFFVHVRAD